LSDGDTTETGPFPTGVEGEAPLRVIAPGSPELERIVRLLARSPEVRTELVDDIRTQMDGREYMSDEKLNLAIWRMLKDVLE